MQPSGTVTFVFTDIEGSTRPLERLGENGYRETLAVHRARIRAAFAAHDGYEVDNEGDSFFYAFQSATAAVSAVREAMADLEAAQTRVRVGIHSGEPALDPRKYVGMDVHRAARIMACAHGGQTVLSRATRELLDNGVDLRDLGEHRLKDLSTPIRLYQLGNGDFPPLRSLHRNNLPVPSTAFIGRERELAEVVSLLTRDDVSLLTLTGPGGTGKTRLALQAAAEASERFPDGMWWVSLAPLRNPALVLSAVAQSLDLREETGRDIATTLADGLNGKRLLLLLDNAEHLLPTASAAIAALNEIRGPSLVVTSRERLKLGGEQLYPVPSLIDEDAVALFTARARQLDPSFTSTPAVASLCQRVDNLPLPIELAAARTSLFSPEQLLERIGERLDLLKGSRDADLRQQTLRATIDWSYELLDAEERRVFRGFSVFAGGATLAAAEEVCDADADTVQSLLDKSLVRRRDTKIGPRYWMLESLREYALEQMVQESEAVEVINFRAGIDWALRGDHAAELARLAASLGLTWVWRGEVDEVRRWLDLACEQVGDEDQPLRARVLMVDGFVRAMQGHAAAAEASLEEALGICRELEDIEGVGFCLNSLGIAAARRGDDEQARAFWEACRQLGSDHGMEDRLAIATLNLSGLALRQDRFDEARVLAEEASRTFAEAKSPLWCNTLLILGEAARRSGHYADAKRTLGQCLEACAQRNGRTVGAIALTGLAAVAVAQGDDHRAALLLGADYGGLESARLTGQTEDETESLRIELLGRVRDSGLEAVLAEGRSMSLADVARFVLDD
ncbi:MAG: adenylate/guanylate cyclase domain-containing protein [Actinobacteria bacterium]|nr:MAG: adenylate/guanylate cyclase domain-containing protein [Actinomycetota bacterium]